VENVYWKQLTDMMFSCDKYVLIFLSSWKILLRKPLGNVAQPKMI